MHPTLPRRIRTAVVAGALALVGLTLAACSSSSTSSSTSTSTTAGGPVTLRLGYLTNLTHAGALVGVSNGTFTRNLPSGTTLTTSTFSAGPAEVTALLSGSLDAAYIGPSPAITAYTQSGGKAIRIISGATSGGAALVVSSSITSPSQLKGKTLSTPQLGNTQDIALRTWLTSQGLTYPGPNGGSGDVTILPQQNSAIVTAFEAGAIAGAWVPEPYVSEMVSQGHGHVLVNEKTLWPGGRFATTVLVVTQTFAQAHPSVVDGLLKGQIAVNAFLNSSPTTAAADANAALAKLTGKPLKAAALASAWADMTFTNDPIVSSILTDVQHAKAAGFPSGSIAGIFDLGPLNSLLQTAGKTTVPTS